jgi:O-antigen ligase
MTKDYPIAGIGFGMQSYYDKALLDEYNARVSIKYKQHVPIKAPHNFLVDVAVRTGLVGLGLFLYILFASIRMSWNVIRQAKDNFLSDWALCCMGALFAILIQGLFENTMSGPPAIVLYAIFAMMTILWRLNTESETMLNNQQDAAT